MVYCISDIHGEYDRYLAMLDLIGFSDNDTLYVIGDCIDRYSGGVDILKDIMSRHNVHMLLGNHEDMAYGTLGPNNVIGAREMWVQNGGGMTRRELLYLRTPSERMSIMQFISSLPDHINVEIKGRKFHLVHGYPADSKNARIWTRPEPDWSEPIPGTTVIIGHTPTVFLAGDDGMPFRIWYGNGVICIDCGCGNETELRRLACLRLDDMREFYV